MERVTFEKCRCGNIRSRSWTMIRARAKALARLLSVIGYRPVLFESAGDFMSAAATSEALCVLVDINLGETSGLDLARQLSVAGFKFPLIFITGVDDDTIRKQCRDFGCVAFLGKPFDEGRLVEAVAKAVGIQAFDKS